jgi:hypothetical protein
MLSKVITHILTSRLGKYLSGLENLTAGFWSGQVQVSNVQIRPDLFHRLDLPFALVSGVVGRLEAKVPWTRLWTDSVSVELKDLVVVVRPVGSEDWKYSEESYVAGIARALEGVELSLRSEYRNSLLSGDDKEKQDSYMQQVTASVLARLQVSIQNIHFRVLIPYNHRQAALGFVLRSVSLTSLEASEATKRLSLSGLIAYCDTKKDAAYHPNSDFEMNLQNLLMLQAEGIMINIDRVEAIMKTGSLNVVQGNVGEIVAELGPQQAKVIIGAAKLVFEYRKFVKRE